MVDFAGRSPVLHTKTRVSYFSSLCPVSYVRFITVWPKSVVIARGAPGGGAPGGGAPFLKFLLILGGSAPLEFLH